MLLRGQRMADEQGVILTNEVALQAVGIHRAKNNGHIRVVRGIDGTVRQ